MMETSDKSIRALSQFDGKNKVTLPKNIVGTENILTTSMISAANTIYILQYDYSLNSQTVVLGSGSTIIFNGGSLNNGTLDYRNGKIIPSSDSIFGSNLRVLTSGSVNIAWYGKSDGDSIDDIFNVLQGHTVIIPVGNYSCGLSDYLLEPGTMFIGEKVLNNDLTCCISFSPSATAGPFIIGLNNNCGFKDITLWLTSTTYSGDLVRVDSASWPKSEYDLQPLKGQQYYIDNVYFFTSWMQNGSDNYLATAFHVIIRDKDDNEIPLESYRQFLSYRQHFQNVEIKYFNVGIRIELKNYNPHLSDEGVWCNSLHFFDIDMWVRNNGFVLETTNIKSLAVGRFLISGICLQAVGTPDSHYPYAFYANNGYKCMLDMINAWDNSKVAYVGGGEITLGQYVADDSNPLTVTGGGIIRTIPWI